MNEVEQEIIRALQNGSAGVAEIGSLLSESIPRRTLQRRLDELVSQGKVERFGRARATKYRAKMVPLSRQKYDASPPVSLKLREPEPLEEAGATEIVPFRPPPGPSLGEESKQLRHYLRDHYSLRTPCGYRREFLDSYIPNKTFYLGESLREHLRKVGQSSPMKELPPGTYARQVLDRLIIDLTWNSSRLEGSTYSLLETDHLLHLGKSEDPKRVREAQMVLNHKYAIEFLVEEPQTLGFNRYTLLNLHAVLTDGLMESHSLEGALRQRPVGITGTVYHPTRQPALIEECFEIILKKAGAIEDPIECAFFVMVHMPYLQPFEDGNKRMSRLTANLPLVKGNLSPLSFVGVSVRDYTDGILAVYELNKVALLRDVFAWAFEQSAKRYVLIREEIGDPDPVQMRYRKEIHELVRDVVVNRLDKPAAARAIQRWATHNVTDADRAKFVQIVEERMLALTEVNGVRYRIRPSEFAAWWPGWKQ